MSESNRRSTCDRAPTLTSSPKPRARPPRHRPSEPLAPRASDRVATRLAALAAWARQQGLAVQVDGRRVDAACLQAIAREQAAAEAKLGEVWRAFQEVYAPHTERTREREAFLLRTVDAIERAAGAPNDATARALLRACRLRTPPKALALAVASIDANRCNAPPGP